MDFYLGIDIGTSRVKAVLFDQHFTARASAAENTSPRLSANGYAEQDMTQLWHSVLAILRQIARHPALQAGRLRAIGLAGQGEGVWLSDEQGEPVGPGILWSDTRSHALMSDLLRRPGFDRRYFADTGTHLQPCNTSLQLYWLKQYQPERLAAARYLFFAKDWIRFRLTGVAALELTDASSSLLNQQSGSWSSVVMNEMGLDELLPLFPPLLAPDAPAGTLSDAVAALTGLPAATPVAAGALDVCSAALGCGAVNEGDIYTILGTTCCTGIVCRGPQTVNEATRFVTHTEAGQVISLFPMQAGTPNIDWLQQHISLDADLGRLEQAIADVEPGSGGVFWQPYLNGERAPFYSPDARAGFIGISPHTTRAELQRAVFEGLAFAIVDALQGYPQGGELYLTGGGAASATWLQIIADCTGRTVVSSAFNELSARGAAILAARSVAALAETPPLAQTRYQPRPQAHARYAALYPVYRLLREQMLPVWQARQAALQHLSQEVQP
ncbi:TPA: FGGY-family carbohydrate kinase [Klebsiella quasipneumoniae subsp. quasipneumoniae]|uniref:Carbohydrate kinase n=1 Tax=Klebsiella quasipneumoniae TaxID=1463165 RepID=A0AAI8IYD5_9ENTR|nr:MULTISPECIES: FGGY-family carbohydrate kinase [Klebsiella]AWL55516.1 carbohydrate kinase [Klebsiella quasipneumoniae]AWL65096.1 carbohydrate kinase [Klebsiella quasipneumoniae]AWL73453.1 carbohydrate kinase [Klebsiella quasipneumoniae]AZA43463.1 carbohydrate kinase [Klebsiella quasipneumoniae]EKZ5320713.1 carbohydrate kinase [Klebsiella quasipneumoniae]